MAAFKEFVDHFKKNKEKFSVVAGDKQLKLFLHICPFMVPAGSEPHFFLTSCMLCNAKVYLPLQEYASLLGIAEERVVCTLCSLLFRQDFHPQQILMMLASLNQQVVEELKLRPPT